jgi:hypothetical protein
MTSTSTQRINEINDIPTNYRTLEDLYVRLITSVPSSTFEFS